ncbi:hypothetical protein RCH18_002985 [Flavobacterium sp. PL11]|uniref:hypothetical protein n=1 Tax=Flavobacterium sp. PL11 TaxID=3071717 RepID=UPI002E0A4C43|nr:hypothetical protein [Flavobacterium sp. PL11]
MKKVIIPTSINIAIDAIDFDKKRFYWQAKLLVSAIYRQFLLDKDNVDFRNPKPFPTTFFEALSTSNGDLRQVKRGIEDAKILITNGSYSTGSKITAAFCKSYVLSAHLIYNHPVHFTQFEGITRTDDRVAFTEIKKDLKMVTVDDAVFNYIPKLVEKEIAKIKIGTNITRNMITIKINGDEINKHRSCWLAVANRKNVGLIECKNNFYLEPVLSFMAKKRIELEMCYTFSIENIRCENFYASRNSTNNRLDHNLTGLKRELFKYILLDGKKTTEIDIKNAQFAILSNISTFKLDDNFIENAQNGTLYEYIQIEMKMSRDEAKQYMMIALFGEVRSHPKKLKTLFPKTMKSISDYKNENGYKSFSILLQKAESKLMIDGVYNLLYKNKIPTLPIHDSMRVKACDYDTAKQIMIDFFNRKNFKCELKSK